MDARRTDATETMAETSSAVSRVGLTLVHHPDRNRLGERFEVVEGEHGVMGRGRTGLASGRIDDRTVSKRHATLSVRPGPAGAAIWVEDHDSRNGTRVNGVEVSRAQLHVGDVLALGRIMFVIDADARPGPATRGRGFDAFAASTCAVLRVGAQLATDTPRWIWGPHGAGKTALARAWSPADARVLDARDPALATLSGTHSAIVEHIDEADGATLEALCAALGTTNTVFTSTLAPHASTSVAPLVETARAWSFQLPGLAQRPADIAAIAWSCARADAQGRALSPQLLLALHSTSWPTNATGIRAVLQRAMLESTGECIDVFDGLSKVLRPSCAATDLRRLRVAHTHLWFEGANGERADLSRNPLLRRVLALLVQHHQRRAEPLDVDAVFAHAWPDEQASETSRTNRVYVALTKLRKAGLRDVLERTETGYRLHPELSVEVVRER